ncbi:MAG: TauD/TfdA family dioxygenase, partial [Rhodospirillales bacterium]|nr:TauD/TfdA family dioxygenase [Rhodospirillales bacterium]
MDVNNQGTAVPMEPVADPAGWYAEDIERTGDGTFTWDAGEVADIEAAMAAFEESDRDLVTLNKEDFPLGRAAAKMKDIRNEVTGGVGFALIHGLTMDTYSRRQAAIIFLGLGQHIGQARSQNYHGHILGHVKDLGFDQATDPLARAYHCRNELNYHSDSCNVVALFCLHHAMKGGVSRVTSGITVYNEMLKRRPELTAA